MLFNNLDCISFLGKKGSSVSSLPNIIPKNVYYYTKVCVKKQMCSMYRKYLLKRHFWAQPRKGGEPQCYVKHDVRTGGVYAYLQHRGVRIVTEGDQRSFNNFDELDEYLDKLSVSTRDDTSQFLSILNRRTTTKMLRQLPL